MIDRGAGRIINIGSIAGRRMTFFGSLDYTVSKYGVEGLTQHLAWELADQRITVNSICPGGVVTPLMEENITPAYREMVTKRLVPLGRMCTMEEIGETASFLASDRAAMITGQSIAVDGGALTGYGEDLRPVIRKRNRMKAIDQWNTAWDPFYELDPAWTDQFFATAVPVYASGVMSTKDVELLSIAFDASYTHLYAPGTRRHIKGALAAGATVEEIMEVLKLCVAQGVQSCNLGVPILAEEMAKRSGG